MPAAVVFGANGISGTAMLDALVKQTPQHFSTIIGVSRRPPQMEIKDPRVKFVSIDILSSSVNELAKKLQDILKERNENLTAAFHYTYVEKKDENEAASVNEELLQKALDAVAIVVAKNTQPFQSFLLQTGYKYYGVQNNDEKLSASQPFKEDAPRIPGPNFYYNQEDALRKTCEAHGWAWIVTRPNVIIGVSKGNFMNFAVSIGLYAALQKELGQPLVFPGNQFIYEQNIVDHSWAKNNAEFQLWATMHLDKTKNHAFNIHDGGAVRFKDLWPKIAKYVFSVILSLPSTMFQKPMPDSAKRHLEQSMAEYMADPAHQEALHRIAKRYNLDENVAKYATWEFADFMTGGTLPHEGDMTAAREAGWTRTIDTWKAYQETFDDMKRLWMIPTLREVPTAASGYTHP
ncbi:hypothetical protein DFS34DRAFT_575386 [Phlyctochytrium arcticum]|nr:hypothetical protein DFS34DRAFT_575386 [Phlyctochytrium arcticum]